MPLPDDFNSRAFDIWYPPERLVSKREVGEIDALKEAIEAIEKFGRIASELMTKEIARVCERSETARIYLKDEFRNQVFGPELPARHEFDGYGDWSLSPLRAALKRLEEGE